MLSDGPTTYRTAMVEILRRITEGPWGPGTLLPGEVDLAAEFNCSRTTINRALREVSEMGLIDRRRKSGTRVRMAPLREARFQIPLARGEVEAAGASYGYRLISRAIAPGTRCPARQHGAEGRGATAAPDVPAQCRRRAVAIGGSLDQPRRPPRRPGSGLHPPRPR